MLRAWVLIVFSDTYSSLPISRRDSCEDSSRSTASSRSDSSSALSPAAVRTPVGHVFGPDPAAQEAGVGAGGQLALGPGP